MSRGEQDSPLCTPAGWGMGRGRFPPFLPDDNDALGHEVRWRLADLPPPLAVAPALRSTAASEVLCFVARTRSGVVPACALQRRLLVMPQDTSAVLEILNEELGALLRLDDAAFWSAVQSDGSLGDFIDSYLRHRRRGHDPRANAAAGAAAAPDSEAGLALARRVFSTLLRIVSPSSAFPAGSSGVSAAQGSALAGARLATLPQLLDAAALYGPHNAQLTALLVSNAFTVRPDLWGDLTELPVRVAENLSEVRSRTAVAVRCGRCSERCVAARRLMPAHQRRLSCKRSHAVRGCPQRPRVCQGRGCGSPESGPPGRPAVSVGRRVLAPGPRARLPSRRGLPPVPALVRTAEGDSVHP